jgi:hypothetical protein
MKNRKLILTAMLPLLACSGLSHVALAADSAPVTVVNTTTNAETSARNAVQSAITLNLQGTLHQKLPIPIPAGKIFVLETVSFAARGGSLIELAIAVSGPEITGDQITCEYYLTLPPGSKPNFQAGSQALRLYAQPGTSLVIIGQAISSATVDVSLSGYFVDAQ